MKNNNLVYQIRRIILEQAKRANVGHIGSALSIADIIAALYGGVIKIPGPDYSDRDRFILSKGHAALALYAVLYLKKIISKDELDTYCNDNSLLGVHQEHLLQGVDFTTGSLGHGLSMGAGASLAARLQNSKRKIYVLVSDAECNEGSIWEAVMFASHHRLSNLVAIVDLNGQQAFGYTKDVLSLSPLANRWQAFNWDVQEADGHNIEEMTVKLKDVDKTSELPHVLITHTVFGKGVSFMENKIKWHYWPMSDNEYKQALGEIRECHEKCTR